MSIIHLFADPSWPQFCHFEIKDVWLEILTYITCLVQNIDHSRIMKSGQYQRCKSCFEDEDMKLGQDLPVYKTHCNK